MPKEYCSLQMFHNTLTILIIRHSIKKMLEEVDIKCFAYKVNVRLI